ncbi:DUF3422 domain-containing protein [Parasphingopyxis sp.]|uniref:DUF3422 domain-containing protein n=1 Tax=Parasphingopyxis sp. TaxID=1920299 RepID=UPI0026326E61|nr:DUF3422 domain-containing protein [Parasphingopyxis sp.]
MVFTEHPLRRGLVREMHMRRFVEVPIPCEIVQMVWVIEDAQREQENRMLQSAPDGMDFDIDAEAKHITSATQTGATFVWEQHTEASTITAILPPDARKGRQKLFDWMENWPGAVVRATRLTVEASESDAENRLDEMEFNQADLVSCHLSCGVRLWSDFGIHQGYGRTLIAANDAPSRDLGRIVQRVQELGNYRNMALLGFPLVQDYAPRLSRLERQLADYAQMLERDPKSDDEALLDQLTELSSELALIRVETGYRLGATRAYAEIAANRLEKLDIRPITGFPSLTDFTERRLLPAMRTCESFESRLNDLSERTDGVIALLNTRIDTRIKAQNRDLLSSMESSLGIQLRLQSLIEGLSVIAATYYAVGLIAYLVKGGDGLGAGFGADVIIALLVFPVMAAIYFFVRHQRVKILKTDEKAGEKSETGDGARSE